MKSNILLAIWQALKLPLKLLVAWLGKKPKRTKTEHERKLLAHVRNFAPTHYSWQQRIGKNKRRKKNKKFYLVKRLRIIQ